MKKGGHGGHPGISELPENTPGEVPASMEIQRGWKRRSGKNRLNSIMIPAVRKNQIAANTGAVVRNFFMDGLGGGGRTEGERIQRGETVTLASDSSRSPPLNSLKAARGQVAAARVLLKASGRSIWISFMVASLPPRTARR